MNCFTRQAQNTARQQLTQHNIQGRNKKLTEQSKTTHELARQKAIFNAELHIGLKNYS
jgi:hypothetical protein